MGRLVDYSAPLRARARRATRAEKTEQGGAGAHAAGGPYADGAQKREAALAERLRAWREAEQRRRGDTMATEGLRT